MASTSLLLFALIVSSLVAVSDLHDGCTSTYSSDCQSYQVCCNNVCIYGSNCIGYSCSIDSDCGNWGSCCFGTCQNTYDDCSEGTVIVGAIFGSLLGIFLIAMCIFFACRRQRRAHHGRVIVGGRVTATATTTTTTRTATQTNPLYPGQAAQSYQQGYPYYQPQYEQHEQTAIPPPYSPAGRMIPPPPYTEAAQGRSGGGVYSPKPSYGAVPLD